MRLRAIHENAALAVGAALTRQPISLKASIRTRFPRFQGIRAIRSVGRAAWSFCLDDSCNVPDFERYGSNSPSISNFSTRQAERSVGQPIFVLWRE